MVERKKELDYVKHYNTCMALFELPCTNDVCEVEACNNSGLLSNATQLIGIKKAI